MFNLVYATVEKKDYGNFIELFLVEEANKVPMERYRFIDGLSGKRGTFCFIKRKESK